MARDHDLWTTSPCITTILFLCSEFCIRLFIHPSVTIWLPSLSAPVPTSARERGYAARLSAISSHALSGSVRCMLCSPLSSTMTLMPSPQSSSRLRISGTQSFPPRSRTTSTPHLSMPGSISVSSTTAPPVPAMSEHHGKFISHVVRYILPAKISETHL